MNFSPFHIVDLIPIRLIKVYIIIYYIDSPDSRLHTDGLSVRPRKQVSLNKSISLYLFRNDFLH